MNMIDVAITNFNIRKPLSTTKTSVLKTFMQLAGAMCTALLECKLILLSGDLFGAFITGLL